ncbi:imidazole glycerol phosphate synthase subunit HisF [Candidatus Tachikawaea gelatinosa]|uniref:Imidazole glycerol phosphate synthase subunit HisF n=1 Tax=Candidatus Tachikawaea gelatinosa TaxID=1410383 RepID=A0A090AQS8_9ENTR|nr:imidazole glycerol phosphate synthase subunit HisF [Candidatus Tachikawaea gelatinosa]BAP58702.1 imidazole glycerol phosphate synthase subunit HisF [Candidatus Tachikawaea gelatinosa]
MLAKRIIPCLDVKDGKVIKGIQFINHKVVGDIIDLVKRYVKEGADELVFYDITASSNKKKVNKKWIAEIADVINIPFCVAGGIKTVDDAEEILYFGADKISINSPALSDPKLINRLSKKFGKQCIVVGIDAWFDESTQDYYVKKYTGNISKTCITKWNLFKWIKKVQKLGAGEIVLNAINQDGMKQGYNIFLFRKIREICKVPLIASGGAGNMQHFLEVFNISKVDGALAASIFHSKIVNIYSLKKFLIKNNVEIRLC